MDPLLFVERDGLLLLVGQSEGRAAMDDAGRRCTHPSPASSSRRRLKELPQHVEPHPHLPEMLNPAVSLRASLSSLSNKTRFLSSMSSDSSHSRAANEAIDNSN